MYLYDYIDRWAIKETIEESTIGFTSTPIPDANETCVQSTSKGNYKSEWYKNMTPE